MIEITFDADNYELSIKGHANTAEKGKDIVCSAVSILYYTLCEGIEKLRGSLSEEPKITMDDGDGTISCKPTKEGEATVSMVYWTVLNGYVLLAESYPDAVIVK